MKKKLIVSGLVSILFLGGVIFALNFNSPKVEASEKESSSVLSRCSHQGSGSCDCQKNGASCSCGGSCQKANAGSCSCQK